MIQGTFVSLFTVFYGLTFFVVMFEWCLVIGYKALKRRKIAKAPKKRGHGTSTCYSTEIGTILYRLNLDLLLRPILFGDVC